MKRKHPHVKNFIDLINWSSAETTKEINTDKVQKTFFAASDILWFSCSFFEWHMSEVNYNATQKAFQLNLFLVDISATGNDNSTMVSLVPATRKFLVLEWKLGPLQNPTECTDRQARQAQTWATHSLLRKSTQKWRHFLGTIQINTSCLISSQVLAISLCKYLASSIKACWKSSALLLYEIIFPQTLVI